MAREGKDGSFGELCVLQTQQIFKDELSSAIDVGGYADHNWTWRLWKIHSTSTLAREGKGETMVSGRIRITML